MVEVPDPCWTYGLIEGSIPGSYAFVQAVGSNQSATLAGVFDPSTQRVLLHLRGMASLPTLARVSNPMPTRQVEFRGCWI